MQTAPSQRELDKHSLPDRDKNARELIHYLEAIRELFPEHKPDFPVLAASFIAVCYDAENS